MLRPNQPIALTIAGSDSGGEAGIQADLKTFFELGVHGTAAVTCVTAQNPGKISRLEPVSPKMVRAQLEAIANHFALRAAKTGMLHSARIVREIVQFLKQNSIIPLIVDPVMISTSGRRLLEPGGLRVLQEKLLPLATLVTPNLAEAEILLGERIRSLEELRAAARKIWKNYGCAALVKGGHLAERQAAVDFYHGPEGEWMLATPRLAQARLHGTGCVYSAAITAGLARGKPRLKAVELGKNFIAGKIYEANAGLAVQRARF